MAASALVELELVIEVFEKGCAQSFKARQAYVCMLHFFCHFLLTSHLQTILRELKNKADASYTKYRNRHASPALDIQLNIGPEAEISASRLAIFGGQTRVMSSKLLSRRRPNKRSSQAASCTASPGPSTAGHSSADTPPRDTSPGASTAASSPSDSGSSIPQNVSEAFAQVHPSLVEYLSLFPSSASLAVVDPPQQLPMNGGGDATMTPLTPVNYAQQGLNGVNGMNGSGMGASGMDGSGMNGTGMNSASTSFPPMFSDMGAQPTMGPGVPPPTAVADTSNLDFFGSADPNIAALSIPSLNFTEDVMMTEHWMNLMRQTGILDNNGSYVALSNGQQQQHGQQQFMPQQSTY